MRVASIAVLTVAVQLLAVKAAHRLVQGRTIAVGSFPNCQTGPSTASATPCTPRCSNDDELHPFRCCSSTAISGWGVDSCGSGVGAVADACSNVWAESLPDCAVLSYNDAATACQDAGGRLCTEDELAANCAECTGCYYDHKLLWTSSTQGCVTSTTTITTTTTPTTTTNTTTIITSTSTSTLNAKDVFAKGDFVRAVAGTYAGKHGVVTNVYAASIKMRQCGTGGLTDGPVPFRQFEKVNTKDDVPDFEVGDYVRPMIDGTVDDGKGTDYSKLEFVVLGKADDSETERAVYDLQSIDNDDETELSNIPGQCMEKFTTTVTTTTTTTHEDDALDVGMFVIVHDGVHPNKYGHIKSFSGSRRSATILTCNGSIDGDNTILLKFIKKVDDTFDATLTFGDHVLFKYGDYEGQTGTIKSIAEGGKTVRVTLPSNVTDLIPNECLTKFTTTTTLAQKNASSSNIDGAGDSNEDNDDVAGKNNTAPDDGGGDSSSSSTDPTDGDNADPNSIAAAVGGILVLAGIILIIVMHCQNRKAAARNGAAELEQIDQHRNTLEMVHNPKASAFRAHAAAKKKSAATSVVNNPGFVGITLADDGGGKSSADTACAKVAAKHPPKGMQPRSPTKAGKSSAALHQNSSSSSSSSNGGIEESIYGRLEEVEPTTQRYQGKLWVPRDFTPEHDCRMTLLRAGDTLGVPNIARMVEDVATRLEEHGILPSHPEYNSRFSLYVYTYHANHLPSESQYYAVLNAGLRSRQEGWFKLWMPSIYYLSRALRELPDVNTTVYKGMAMPANFDKYNGKKKIRWSGFSSTTTSEAVAQKFAGIGGLVLKINVFNGKNVQPYSWFGKEEAELVLSPNMEFIVKGFPDVLQEPYMYAGRTYIVLVQLPNETLYS